MKAAPWPAMKSGRSGGHRVLEEDEGRREEGDAEHALHASIQAPLFGSETEKAPMRKNSSPIPSA